MNILRNPEMKKTMHFLYATAAVLSAAGFAVNIACGIYTLFSSAVFIFAYYFISRKRYKKMAELSDVIDRVLHGEEALKISDGNEGELAILKDEIEKMLIRLREQNEELLKERAYLSDSIADISHQLRTPLTSINLIITLLQSEDLTAERHFELLGELKKLVEKTDKLVSTLLKISKIDAGTVKFEEKDVSVFELIEFATQPLAVMLDIKGHSLSVNVKDETYKGDLAWSIEAVGNILKNCIEHTPEGGMLKIDASETPIYTQIEISDNGSGIDEEDLPHLFERFYKGKNSNKDSFGIGLALAKSIVNEQNGIINAENIKNGGAKFTLRFYKTTV